MAELVYNEQGRLLFTEEMRKEYTILIPQMLPVHFTLLEKIFNNNELIEWWIYEKNFGKDFQKGDLISNGKNIDLSTSEKFYDYLMEEMKSEHEL